MLAVEHLFLWFLFYSFLGWVYESILVSVQERRFVNRGFLNGPLCPIYGTGAVLASLLLGGLSGHPVLLFLVSALGASVLEYATSWAMERLFHARWWDYTDFRFNLNGRVCLLGAVVFGLGGVAIVRVVQTAGRVLDGTDASAGGALAVDRVLVAADHRPDGYGGRHRAFRRQPGRVHRHRAGVRGEGRRPLAVGT